MKTGNNIYASLLALTLYISATVAGYHYFSNTPFQSPTASVTACDTTHFSAVLYCDTSTAESSTNSIRIVDPGTPKDTFNKYSVFAKSGALGFKRKFSQYTHAIVNFPIAFQKTSIIFPFHYFW